MVAENESLSAVQLQNRLRAMGYAVTRIVSSKEEAIERADRDHPHLALLDIKLPNDADGIELARLLQERYRIPVIYVTSQADEETVRRAAATYPLNYLVPPLTDEAFRAAIEIGLHRHRRDSAVQESSKVLTTTLEVLGGAMILTDEHGFIRKMSSVAEELTGWKDSETTAKHLREVYVLRDEDTGEIVKDPLSIMHLKSEIVPTATRYALISRNGIPIPVVTAIVGVNDCEGDLDGMIVAFQDSSQMVMPEQFWNSYAANLHLSGLLLCNQGHYGQAERCFKRALTIWERHLERDNPKLSRTLEGLAEVCERTGNIDKAKELRARAAALRAGVPFES